LHHPAPPTPTTSTTTRSWARPSMRGPGRPSARSPTRNSTCSSTPTPTSPPGCSTPAGTSSHPHAAGGRTPGPVRPGRAGLADARAGRPDPHPPRRLRHPGLLRAGHLPARARPRAGRLGSLAALARHRGACRGCGRRDPRFGGRLPRRPPAAGRAGHRAGGRLAAALPGLPRHPGVARRRQGGAGHRPAAPPAHPPRGRGVPRRGDSWHPGQRRPCRDRPRRGRADRLQALHRPRLARPRRAGVAQPVLDGPAAQRAAHGVRRHRRPARGAGAPAGVRPRRPRGLRRPDRRGRGDCAAGRLVNVLTAAGQRLRGADVRALVAQAHTMLRPA
jgi:hypothetical protein